MNRDFLRKVSEASDGLAPLYMMHRVGGELYCNPSPCPQTPVEGIEVTIEPDGDGRLRCNSRDTRLAYEIEQRLGDGTMMLPENVGDEVEL